MGLKHYFFYSEYIYAVIDEVKIQDHGSGTNFYGRFYQATGPIGFDLNQIQCVIGWVLDGGKWAIVDRSTSDIPYIIIHPSFARNSYPVNRWKLYLKIHPSFARNSYPVNRWKIYLKIHPSFARNSYVVNRSKTHTEYYPFLCWKKGGEIFIPISSILNSYL